jgi:CHASE3 domain sensor protein
MSEQDQLSKNDLYILMESYKNNIQLNTTLLEQQKQLMVMNDTSIQKQKELCNTLDDFIKNISTCSQEILKNNVEIIKKIEESTSEIKNQSALESERIHNKLYIALIGMIGIVISVIGLAIAFAEKFNSLRVLIGK